MLCKQGPRCEWPTVPPESTEAAAWPKVAQVTQDYDAGPDLHLKTGTQIYVELGKSQGSYRFARADDDDIRGAILKSYVKLLE